MKGVLLDRSRFFLRRMLDAGALQLSSQAVILCGGLGTRLGALTVSTPKPLLSVAGRPFLDLLLFELGRHGVYNVVFLAAFQAAQIEDYIVGNPVAARFNMDLKISLEPGRAGTAGAIFHAKSLLEPEFLLLNGDSWLDFNLLGLPPLTSTTDAVLSLRELPDASRSGVVTVEEGRVKSFRERPSVAGPGLVNAGVYRVSRRIVEVLPENGSFENDVLPQLAMAGKLGGTVRDGYFIDIGVPETYAQAQIDIPMRQRRPAVFLDRDGVLNHDDAYVGSVDRFRWIDGAPEAIRSLNDAGFYVFVVTNQAGVARGFYTEEDVNTLHRWMNRDLAKVGAHIDDFRYCPFHIDAVDSRYRRESDWRKPGAGMLRDLIRYWPIDISQSHMIGDKVTDIEAGIAVCLKSHLFKGKNLKDFTDKCILGSDK